MYALIIIAIIISLIIGLFSVAVVGRDVVVEAKDRRQYKKATAHAGATNMQDNENTLTMPFPFNEGAFDATQNAESEVAASEDENLSAIPELPEMPEVDENAVAFSRVGKTLDEKYLELSPEQKGYYDEIVRFAMAVEGSKRYKNAAYEEYKVGKSRLVRIKIRRDVIVCEFVIANLTFKNYISDNKVAIKQAPATIKVTDETSLSAVKDSIGIAIRAIDEEKAYKKEQAKIRRRENRRAKAEANKEQE